MLESSLNLVIKGDKKMGKAIVWFRNLLRIHDNPLLNSVHSSEEIDEIIPIYIIDVEWFNQDSNAIGHNRKKFLFESLLDLNQNFKKKYGTNILILYGKSSEVISSIIESLDSELKYLICDYCSEPRKRNSINEIKDNLSHSGIGVKIFPAVNTILDIEIIIQSPNYVNPKSAKDIDKIFRENFEESPNGYFVGESLSPPDDLRFDLDAMGNMIKKYPIKKYHVTDDMLKNRLTKLKLDFNMVDSYFIGGEKEGLERLKRKISKRPDFVNSFKKPNTISTNKKDNPLEPTTTGLSPYLSNGCLSPRLVWNECLRIHFNSRHENPPESLHGQLMFREMFYLLSRSVKNWDNDVGNSNCKTIRWGDYDNEKIKAWESGKTGFPYIDAMMRQLESTGWMHHLGRHAVSCFLTRGQLWQNWKYGRDIFEKKLVDSDWALNNGNWLWLAGVAPFSMPYYRIYNPCPDSKSSLNVETIETNFIRQWIPELAMFPSKYIYEPHLAPIAVQKSSECIIGTDYPYPMVDRKLSRKENLILFKQSNERILASKKNNF